MNSLQLLHHSDVDFRTRTRLLNVLWSLLMKTPPVTIAYACYLYLLKLEQPSIWPSEFLWQWPLAGYETVLTLSNTLFFFNVHIHPHIWYTSVAEYAGCCSFYEPDWVHNCRWAQLQKSSRSWHFIKTVNNVLANVFIGDTVCIFLPDNYQKGGKSLQLLNVSTYFLVFLVIFFLRNSSQ